MSQVPNNFLNKEGKNKINHTGAFSRRRKEKEKEKKKPIFPSSNKETKNGTSE